MRHDGYLVLLPTVILVTCLHRETSFLRTLVGRAPGRHLSTVSEYVGRHLGSDPCQVNGVHAAGQSTRNISSVRHRKVPSFAVPGHHTIPIYRTARCKQPCHHSEMCTFHCAGQPILTQIAQLLLSLNIVRELSAGQYLHKYLPELIELDGRISVQTSGWSKSMDPPFRTRLARGTCHISGRIQVHPRN